MTRIFCDRCGREIKQERFRGVQPSTGITRDLCRECLDALRPFTLTLDSGQTVTFANPKDHADAITRLADSGDLLAPLKVLLGSQFDAFWEEWGKRPIRMLTPLLDDVLKHYGTRHLGDPA